jgi:hypothetical protein
MNRFQSHTGYFTPGKMGGTLGAAVTRSARETKVAIAENYAGWAAPKKQAPEESGAWLNRYPQVFTAARTSS